MGMADREEYVNLSFPLLTSWGERATMAVQVIPWDDEGHGSVWQDSQRGCVVGCERA